MTTQLQNNRQTAIGQDNLSAAQGQDLLQNQGSTVPNVFQMEQLMEQARAAQNGLPNIQPPSDEEISRNMWMASGIMGLVAALVSGNAAGGIAAGMTAALAVHDRGYDLKQRGEYVNELHAKGYSPQAILSWYETGDNKELDKERDEMDKLANDQVSIDMQDARMGQQDQHFNEQMSMQGARLSQMEDHQNAMEEIARDRLDVMGKKLGMTNGWANLGHMNSLASGIYRPLKERVVNLNNKQNYVDQVATALQQMKAGNPVSFNAVLTGLAGMDNPNAIPKEGAIERLEDVGGISQNLRNRLSRIKNGVFDQETINDLQDFAKAHQEDIDTQRQKVFDHAAQTAAGELKAAGVNDQGDQAAMSIAQQVANGDVEDNPLTQLLPGLATNDQSTLVAEGKQGEEKTPSQQSPKEEKKYPGAPPVGAVEGGYKYVGGNPADQSSWEKV